MVTITPSFSEIVNMLSADATLVTNAYKHRNYFVIICNVILSQIIDNNNI